MQVTAVLFDLERVTKSSQDPQATPEGQRAAVELSAEHDDQRHPGCHTFGAGRLVMPSPCPATSLDICDPDVGEPQSICSGFLRFAFNAFSSVSTLITEFSYRIFRCVLRPACKTLGLPLISWHSFRHTQATQLAEVGESLRTAQLLLGHSDLETTLNVYTHAIPDAQRRAVDKVAEVLFTNVHKISVATENQKVN